MISLTSPVETWAHRWPAGLKLGLLCVATMVLFAVQHLQWHLIFFGIAFVLYALPGRRFWVSGLRRLMVLWPFVAFHHR